MSINVQAGVTLLKTFASMVSPAVKFTAISVQTITNVVIELLALINSVQGMTMMIILVALYFHAPQQFRIVGGLSSLYVASKHFIKQATDYIGSKISDLTNSKNDLETEKSRADGQCCEECVQEFFSKFENRFDTKIGELKEYLNENPKQLIILSNHLKSRSKDNLIDEELFQNLLRSADN
eukprot:NODE_486_length_7793_cov_0.204315.p5 type:complete len:181 gc:universal NODE_486_length_7793_cov_0.204315:5402-4860(-)